MTDILIDDNYQMAIAANKDVMIISGKDELLQDIKLEARTAEGDCFYDPEYGWSLLDFLQVEIDELTTLQIQQRIKEKLKKHAEIDQQTVTITITEEIDIMYFKIRFKMSGEEYNIEVNLDRVKAEVI
ncbi:MAG TPA: DUF2634 domain-containing protein [Lactobacillus acetotolerans]|nr:DUF2634 domain-containing protein [Lactobacillus acetotolerans]